MVGCMGHYGETYPLLKAMLLVFFALTHMPGLFDSPETPVENTVPHCVFLSMRVEVTFSENARSLLETHWSVVYLPLWKIWVRQLGSLFTIYGKTCSKPPTSTVQFVALCHMSDNHSPAEIAGGEVFANVITGNPKKGWLEIHWFFCFNRFWYKDIETKWKQHLSILLRSAQFHA